MVFTSQYHVLCPSLCEQGSPLLRIVQFGMEPCRVFGIRKLRSFRSLNKVVVFIRSGGGGVMSSIVPIQLEPFTPKRWNTKDTPMNDCICTVGYSLYMYIYIEGECVCRMYVWWYTCVISREGVC
jgi:hypothetical protein